MDELKQFECSQDLKDFNKAFMAFQKDLGVILLKDTENTFFHSSYASLPGVLERCRGPLMDNGLAYMQLPLGGMAACSLLNRITHIASGQYVQWLFITPLQKNDPQGMGSAITYSRRYNTVSSAGMAENDDDGNATRHEVKPPQTAAATKPQTPPQKPQKQKPAAKAGKMTDKQQKFVRVLMKQKNWSEDELNKFAKASWNVTGWWELTTKEASMLIDAMNAGTPSELLSGLAEVPPVPTTLLEAPPMEIPF